MDLRSPQHAPGQKQPHLLSPSLFREPRLMNVCAIFSFLLLQTTKDLPVHTLTLTT